MPTEPRQTRRATAVGYSKGDNGRPGRPGVGIDAAGAPVIDPTENVLALVDAQARFQREKDADAEKYLAAEIAHVQKYFDMVINSERRRVDDLSALRKDYDKQISETQREQMKTTSDLVSTQLDKVTTSLSETINKTSDNIVATLATMNSRIAEVEKFRYDMGGRAAVSDPAMTQIASDLSQLKLAGGRQEGAEAEAARKVITAAKEAALELQKTQTLQGSNHNTMMIIMAAIAGISLLCTIYLAGRTPTAPIPVYQAAPSPHSSSVTSHIHYISTTYV